MKKRAALLSLLLGAVVLAGCGDDDGGSVTDIEGEGGSSSSSASGSTAGSASGSTTGSASGSAAAAESTGCEIIGGTQAEADTEVKVTLAEYAVVLATNPIPAGIVSFETENTGEEAHEIVIVKGATPEELEIGDEGLDESALPDGAEVLGEIEGFPGGETCTGAFELEAGDYSLVCNIIDEEHGHVHAAEGMLTGMTIT